MNLTGKSHPVLAIAPQAGGSAIAGDYISMKKTEHVTIEVIVAQGHATPPAITLHQATAVAGTGNKVLAKDVSVYHVADADASDLLVKQTDGVAFTPGIALKNKIVIFEVPVDALDMDNGFDCLQVRAGASNVLNLISATYWCSGERYHGKSKIVD